jgi:hypothetical protein
MEYEMIWDSNIGEAYPIKKAKVKLKEFNPSDAPKLYYNSDELIGLNIGKLEHIKLVFLNTNIIPSYIESIDEASFPVRMITIDYEKIILKNANYDYLYVQRSQKDLFFELILGEEYVK